MTCVSQLNSGDVIWRGSALRRIEPVRRQGRPNGDGSKQALSRVRRPSRTGLRESDEEKSHWDIQERGNRTGIGVRHCQEGRREEAGRATP